MHGTLIGAFVTAAGILIGVDSAVTGPGIKPGQTVPKSCETAFGSVATIQGWYGFQDEPTKATSPLLQVFHATCGALGKSRQRPTVNRQAEMIVEALKTDLARYLNVIYGRGRPFTPPLGEGDPHVAYVMVAGYDTPSSPVVAVREVRLRQEGPRWVPFTQPHTRLSFAGCGVRFHGEDKAIPSLMNPKPPARRHPLVEAWRSLENGDCRALTPQTAKSLFALAVRWVTDVGPGFGMAKGAVGGPLVLREVRPDGSVIPETITSY